ncbi:MAG: cysteine desulfurase NifS [Desulfobacterales bacterium]|nr:cysteine desulfurase NifS [Desulfobacterales bacterium]
MSSPAAAPRPTTGPSSARLWLLRDRGRHIVTSAFEHPAVLERLRVPGKERLRSHLPAGGRARAGGCRRTCRPPCGRTPSWSRSCTPTTRWAPSSPLPRSPRSPAPRGIRLHTDAAQSLGKIPVRCERAGSRPAVAGRPQALCAQGRGRPLHPQGRGAGDLHARRRPGNGAAGRDRKHPGNRGAWERLARSPAANLEKHRRHMQAMRDRLHAAITSGFTEVRLNGHPEKRLPNTLSLSFRDLEANRILEAIGLEVAASAGAACHADSVEISHVLKAMAVPVEWAKGTLRLTTGRMTTAAEIDRAAAVIVEAALTIRENRKKSAG